MKKSYLYALFIVVLALMIFNQISLLSIQGNVADVRETSRTERTAGEIQKLAYRPTYVGELDSAHNHADILVLINGNRIDFSKPGYQLQSYYIHFEDKDGSVMHLHAEGIDLKFIMETLGIRFDRNCIVFEGNQFCNNAEKTLKLYVNGKKNNEYGDYEIKDLDRILITFGSESEDEIQDQIGLVTGRSGIFSR